MRMFWARRKAISSIIGGIIILTLFLSALSVMVLVSQQYDAYQGTVNKMSQKDIDRFSENLVAVFPGLAGPTSVTGCGGTCNQYNMTISNMAGIGTQITRIYINSTDSGCTSICVLDLSNTATSYSFQTSARFVNSGETLHSVLIWLPSSVLLPNPTPPSPKSTIYIATTRGRVFTFQWPFPPIGSALGGQSGASISAGIMKIAYQGAYDSKNEPSQPNNQGCHYEQSQPYPAPPGYKEVLSGITGVTGSSLTFVNPWITDTILQTAAPSSGHPSSTLYIYANVINTRGVATTVTGGNLVISAADASSNAKQYFLGGTLLGTYYKGTFYAAGTSATIQPNDNFYLIFIITNWTQGINAAGLVFTGTGAFTNRMQDGTYSGGEVMLDGLYDRTSCTAP